MNYTDFKTNKKEKRKSFRDFSVQLIRIILTAAHSGITKVVPLHSISDALPDIQRNEPIVMYMPVKSVIAPEC